MTTAVLAPVRALSGFVTFALVLLLEAGAAFSLVGNLPVGPEVDVLLAIAFHLGAACLVSFGFWGPWDFSRPDEKNWAVLAFVLILALPVFGVIGYSVTFFVVRIRKNLDIHGPDVLDDFDRYIAYEPDVQSALQESRRPPQANAEGKVDVAPLIDILKSGDRDLKRGAIFSVARLDRKTAVKILRESLMDTDREIQFYATGQLTKIEKELTDQVIRTRRKMQTAPDDLDARIQFGLHCKEYVESGLLDKTVERYFVRQAMEAFEAAVERDGSRSDVLMDLAALQLAQRHYGAAVANYRRVLKLDTDSVTARVGLAHCYYSLGDLGNFGVLVDEVVARGDPPEDLLPLIAFWKGPANGH